ncbi:reverse transcriptase domain-containing protein [Tanacetum coccineum]
MTLISAANPLKSLVICPDKRSNIAQFLNGINNLRRKKRNLKCVRYNVDGEAMVLLVANRDIAKGERLYYDYNAYEHEYPTEHFLYTNVKLTTRILGKTANVKLTSGTQTNKAPVYDSDGLDEVQLYENCYNDEIFNMFTQKDQYTKLLEPIPEPHHVPQNDSNVISEVSSVEQGGGTVEQHSANIEETSAYHESLFHNLAVEVEKVNSVNRKMKETNAELTTELARYKNQEMCFEISQEKYDKLERCYQQYVYQEQCLTKKINALHLSSGKQITALNEEISNLNKLLSKEKSTVSSLQEKRKG